VADGGARGTDEAGGRGTLTVADKVVEKLARWATLQVEGVAPEGSTTGRLGAVLGRGYPSVDVDRAGTRATVDVEVAALWPTPADTVAGRVQEAVRRSLREHVSVDADSVAVTVADLVTTEELGRRSAR
jgi:uncharacterized alkaline shock family protein YloU